MKEKLKPITMHFSTTPGVVRPYDTGISLRSDLLMVQNLLDTLNKYNGRSPGNEEICRYITTVDGTIERQFEAVCLLLQKLSECANSVLQESDDIVSVTRPGSAVSSSGKPQNSRPTTAASGSSQPPAKSYAQVVSVQPIIRLIEHVNKLCDRLSEIMKEKEAPAQQTSVMEEKGDILLNKLLLQQMKLQEQLEQKFLPSIDISSRPTTPLERLKQRKMSDDKGITTLPVSRKSINDTPITPDRPASASGSKTVDTKIDQKAAVEQRITAQILEKLSEQRKQILELEAELENSHAEAASAQKELTELTTSLKDSTAKLAKTTADYESLNNVAKNFKNTFYSIGLYGIDFDVMKSLGIDVHGIPTDLKLPERKEKEEEIAPQAPVKKAAGKADKKKKEEEVAEEPPHSQMERIMMHNALAAQREILHKIQLSYVEHVNKTDAELSTLKTNLSKEEERFVTVTETLKMEKMKHFKEIESLKGSIAGQEAQVKELQSRLNDSIAAVVGHQSRIITKESSIKDTNGMLRLQQLVKEKDRYIQTLCSENSMLKSEIAELRSKFSIAEEAIARSNIEAQKNSDVIDSLEKQVDAAYEHLNITSEEAQRSFNESEEAKKQTLNDKDLLRRLNMDLALMKAKLISCGDVERDLIHRSNEDHQRIARLTAQLEEKQRNNDQLHHELRHVRAECDASIDAFKQSADEERENCEKLQQKISELADVQLNYHKLVDDFENFAKVKYDNLSKMEQEDKELAHIELMLSTGEFDIDQELTQVVDVERRLQLLEEEMKKHEMPQRWMSMRKRLSCNLMIVLHKLQHDSYIFRLEQLRAAKTLKETKENLERVIETNVEYQRKIAHVQATVDILTSANQRKEQENESLSEQLKGCARRVLLLEDTEKQLNMCIDERDKRLSEITAGGIGRKPSPVH